MQLFLASLGLCLVFLAVVGDACITRARHKQRQGRPPRTRHQPPRNRGPSQCLIDVCYFSLDYPEDSARVLQSVKSETEGCNDGCAVRARGWVCRDPIVVKYLLDMYDGLSCGQKSRLPSVTAPPHAPAPWESSSLKSSSAKQGNSRVTYKTQENTQHDHTHATAARKESTGAWTVRKAAKVVVEVVGRPGGGDGGGHEGTASPPPPTRHHRSRDATYKYPPVRDQTGSGDRTLTSHGDTAGEPHPVALPHDNASPLEEKGFTSHPGAARDTVDPLNNPTASRGLFTLGVSSRSPSLARLSIGPDGGGAVGGAARHNQGLDKHSSRGHPRPQGNAAVTGPQEAASRPLWSTHRINTTSGSMVDTPEVNKVTKEAKMKPRKEAPGRESSHNVKSKGLPPKDLFPSSVKTPQPLGRGTFHPGEEWSSSSSPQVPREPWPLVGFWVAMLFVGVLVLHGVLCFAGVTVQHIRKLNFVR